MPKRAIERVKVMVCPDEGCDNCQRSPYGSGSRHENWLYRYPTIIDSMMVFCRAKCAREYLSKPAQEGKL